MGWFVVIPKGDSTNGFIGFTEGENIIIPFLTEADAVEATPKFPRGHTEWRSWGYTEGLERIIS